MTLLLTSRRVLGAVRRDRPAAGGLRLGGAGDRARLSAVEWAAPACRPLILAPCCWDHVLPARRPDSCSPHFDNDGKQTPSPLPTYRCWHSHSPPGLHKPPRSPPQSGIDWAQPHTGCHPRAPGGTGEPPGLCVGRAALREMLLNFLPFDAACPPRL